MRHRRNTQQRDRRCARGGLNAAALGPHRRGGRFRCAAACAALASAAVAAPAMAVNYFRTAAVGDFRVPQFWTPWNPANPGQFQGPGGANDTANFNLGVAPENRYTVTNVFGTNAQLLIHNDALALSLSADYSLVSASNVDYSLRVGTMDGGIADLNISGAGTLFSQYGAIGDVAGSSGTVRARGLQWTIQSGTLHVGRFGEGTLLIHGGAVVSNTGATLTSGMIGSNGGSSGSVTVTGVGSQWMNNGEVRIGHGGTGELTVASGAVLQSNGATLGFFSAAAGTVNVQGANSRWFTLQTITVGDFGSGTLNITNGGLVGDVHIISTSGIVAATGSSVGTVNVSGAGSHWDNGGAVRIGQGGTGTMSITAGGQVSNTSAVVGRNTHASGTVTVSGANSHWNNSGTLRIGESGTGTLSITAGGLVSNTGGVVGLNADSTGTVTVSGTGSTWTNSGMLRVGDGGDGTLRIENGGSVSSAPDIGTVAGIVGWLSGSTGSVTVDGVGSTWTVNGRLGVGIVGSGTLNIANGGVVTSSGIGDVGTQLGSSGTVTVDGAGSTWINSGGLLVGFQGTGSLNVQNGGSVVVGTGGGGGDVDGNAASQVTLDSGGVLDVRGSIDMNGGAFNFLGGTLHTTTYVGNLVNQGGTLSPGNPDQAIGSTSITSNYTQQTGGTLDIEIGGVVPGQFDKVSVAGNATLAGTLKLSLVDGFEPLMGNSFTVLETDFGAVAGKFDQVQGSLPLPGMGLAVVYQTDSVRVQAAIPGDANLDGVVNIGDLSVLASNWQQGGKTWMDGDFTGDGFVNIADLSILASNWQAGVPAAAASMSFAEALAMFDVFEGVVIPEPASVSLLGLTGLLASRRRRRLT